MNLELKILDKEFYQDQALPNYATVGSAGIDLVATRDYAIAPQERVKIGTGIAIHIGSGYTHKQLSDIFDVSIMGMIVPRSGLGTKGLVLANTVGIIDEDYQGETIITAWNSVQSWDGKQYHYDGVPYDEYNTIIVKAGDRIAQLILMPVIKAQFTIVEEFSEQTGRGQGGFGSTGA